MNKIIFGLILIPFSISLMNTSSGNYDLSDRTLASEGDSFSLHNISFDKEDSFVYSSKLTFSSGQAAGVVFGGKENKEYYVFNVDRIDNYVKLIRFTSIEDGYDVDVMYEERFIGNSMMSNEELEMVNPSVNNLSEFQMKVVLSHNENDTYIECFADNIKRFGIDTDIKLDDYDGGYIGLNVYNASVTQSEIEVGETDYSYYTENYRNQFHFSQYSHWNNDPNGLVYYKGYYHAYYQMHPYSNYWGPMHWGHARSKDLVHWEHLPICLFPDKESSGFGSGDGYMWSGSALVYHRGMSEKIDSLHWFSGDEGLYAVFTRDGSTQNQVIMTSDDGNIWTKRTYIPSSLIGSGRFSCRDPKMFPVLKEGNKVTLWGMVVANMEDNRIYFLKSSNMVDWEFSNTVRAPRPECVDVIDVKADDNSMHTLMTVCGRYYLFGNIIYENNKIDFKLEDNTKLSSYSIENHPFKKLDYAGDSYATQSFYVDDTTAPLYGNPISVSWYSGIPNDVNTVESGLCNAATKVWNGGGFTIPVQYGATKVNGEYVLTETPITKISEDFDKTNLISISNTKLTSGSDNPLKDIRSHQLEIEAKIEVIDNAPISFKVNVGNDEYTEFGWNSIDGYYVDKTHASSAGINFIKEGKDVYHVKYASHIMGSSNIKSFYVLVDNNGYEVFAENNTIPFYSLTFASRYSDEASLSTLGEININSLIVNEIGTIWRKDISPFETKLDLESTNVTLDTSFKKSAFISSYVANSSDINWEIIDGNDVISIDGSNRGVNITSLSSGLAIIKATVCKISKLINVKVENGNLSSDLSFSTSNEIGGDWYYVNNGLKGTSYNGDAYLLSNDEGSDFTYSATFSLSGSAAAIIARANLDMSNYIIANYDNNEHICKVWTPQREIGRSGVINVDTNNIGLTIYLKGSVIKVLLNGQVVVDASLGEEDSASGYFGLNVFNGEAIFNDINLLKENYTYDNPQLDLTITGLTSQFIKGIYNVTLKNTLVDKEFYSVNGRNIVISKDYLTLLPTTGKYVFRIVGEASTFEVTVDVNALPEIIIDDVTTDYGNDVSVFIGSVNVESLTINNVIIDIKDYKVANHVLTVSSSVLQSGINEVCINGEIIFNIEVISKKENEENNSGCSGSIISSSSLLSLLSLSALLLIGKRRKKYE